MRFTVIRTFSQKAFERAPRAFVLVSTATVALVACQGAERPSNDVDITTEAARSPGGEVVGTSAAALSSLPGARWSRTCRELPTGERLCSVMACPEGQAVIGTPSSAATSCSPWGAGINACGDFGCFPSACGADQHVECESRPGKNRCYCAGGDAPVAPTLPASDTLVALELAAGQYTTFALFNDGSVWGWGSNEGHALPATDVARTPVKIGVSGVKHVVAGSRGACALRSDGSVQCWGTLGELALTDIDPVTMEPSDTPKTVPGVSGAVGLAMSETHACAWTAAGAVLCWGDGSRGALGDPSMPRRPEATAAGNITDAKQVVVGRHSTCVLRRDGTVSCFGLNAEGRLGQGSGSGATATPLVVGGVSGATSIQGGGLGSFCARTCATTLCWGVQNNYNILGISGNAVTSPHPRDFAGLGPQHAFGAANGCTWTPHGRATCWGNNTYGLLADGTQLTPPTQSPRDVWFAQTVEQIVLGDAHACVLADGGTIRCWGDNSYGQLGDGDPTAGPHQPRQMVARYVRLP